MSCEIACPAALIRAIELRPASLLVDVEDVGEAEMRALRVIHREAQGTSDAAIVRSLVTGLRMP